MLIDSCLLKKGFFKKKGTLLQKVFVHQFGLSRYHFTLDQSTALKMLLRDKNFIQKNSQECWTKIAKSKLKKRTRIRFFTVYEYVDFLFRHHSFFNFQELSVFYGMIVKLVLPAISNLKFQLKLLFLVRT